MTSIKNNIKYDDLFNYTDYFPKYDSGVFKSTSFDKNRTKILMYGSDNNKEVYDVLKLNHEIKYITPLDYTLDIYDDIYLAIILIDTYESRQIIANIRCMYLPIFCNFDNKCLQWYDTLQIHKFIPYVKPATSPLISVIMPNYNCGTYIKDALDTILYRQTYKNIEVIIIDDASTDNSVELITKQLNKNVKLLCNQRNKGAYYSRNRGLKEISPNSKFFTIIDADDRILYNRFVDDLMFFVENPDYVAVRSKMIRANEVTLKLSPTGSTYSPTVILCRTQIIKDIGYFMNVKFGADHDYFIRIDKFYGSKRICSFDKINYIALVRKSGTNLTQIYNSSVRMQFGKNCSDRVQKGITFCKFLDDENKLNVGTLCKLPRLSCYNIFHLTNVNDLNKTIDEYNIIVCNENDLENINYCANHNIICVNDDNKIVEIINDDIKNIYLSGELLFLTN